MTNISLFGLGCAGLAVSLTLCLDGRPIAAKTCIDPTLLPDPIGAEVGAEERLRDGDLAGLSLEAMLGVGKVLFEAVWTPQEGGGRPFTNGVGGPLVDPSEPLAFPRNFNRVSAPDSNSCFGCHNLPFSGGGGDIVTKAFVAAQRFDHATFDSLDSVPRRGATDESGRLVTLQTIGNPRATLGMFGSGYIEALSREMTADLRTIRDSLAPGGSAELTSKGIGFGRLARRADGSYDTSAVVGLPEPSRAGDLPGLEIRPFHQVGNVISLRQFTNNAFNHHHGIQTVERFGPNDPDGDGYCNEMTEDEVTAVAVFQATLQVPAQVVPRQREYEDAILLGEHAFHQIGCTSCHVGKLPLESWEHEEPNRYNPDGNLQPDGGGPVVSVDLNSDRLPRPRLRATGGVVMVPALTDLKLHDITTGPDDPNCEPLDQNASEIGEFLRGNCHFLTRRLWDAGDPRPHFHHGKFTTLREAIANHFGEADAERVAFETLPACGQNAVIEYLKSLQVVEAGTRSTTVDENHWPRLWPPFGRRQRIRQALAACPLS